MKTTATILCALITVAFTSPVVFAQINWTEHAIDGNFDGAWGVYPVDLDDDGDMDVLGAGVDEDEIAWWENDGSQNFTKHVIITNFNHAISVYAIDLDDDGDVDVLGTAGGIGGTNYLVYWWENDGNENFTEHVISSTFYGAYCVYAIDVDGDDDVDVLGAANGDHEIAWWENDGSESFTYHKIDSLYYASWVYSTDLDGDNDIDVLGTSFYDGVFWWENDGQENFTVHALSGDLFGSSVYAIDLDNDDDMDVLATGTSEDDVLWFENDGSQNFSSHLVDGNFDGAWNVHAADMDHDGDMDVVGAAWAESAITWWENDGSQSFTRYDITNSFSRARRGYPIDMDDDGDMDIVGTAHYGDAIHWWESDLGPAAPGFITGVVKEEDDVTPIDNVEVSVYDSGDNLAGTDTTDSNGEFAFSLSPDTYYAAFSKTNYNDTTLTNLVVVSAETTTVNLLMYISGYAYLPGDANMFFGIWPPQCIGGDVTYLVNYFRGNGDACELDGFWASADANGDCNIIGSDVTRLVNYFRGNTTLEYCPDYEPLWLTPDDLPDEAPDGWPGCE